MLRVGGVDAAEVALDDTSIVVGSGQKPMTLRRVEVEVGREWQGALEPLVSELRESCGLRPASLSKFEAGLLAVGRVVPGPPDLGPTDVTPSSTMGQLAFAVIRRQLRVLREKEPGTRLGEDPEELHDMRVATRRLRAALDLFAHVLPARARTYRAELGWLGGVLGEVRDLDVQLQGLQAAAGSSGTWDEVLGRAGHAPLEDLVSLLERDRQAARADMLRALDSVRWERLANGLATMVRQGPLRRSAAGNAPAAIGVPGLVVQRHDAVTKAAKRARRSGRVADFHRLRIRCKRLRYSLEFGAELYEGATTRFVRQLAGLQDKLGQMQDHEVAGARLAELAAGDTHLPASTVFVMGALAERHHRGVEQLLRRLPKEVARTGGREWQDLLRLMERRQAEAEAALPPVRRTLRAVPAPPATETVPADAACGRSSRQPRRGESPVLADAATVPTNRTSRLWDVPPRTERDGWSGQRERLLRAHDEARMLGEDEVQRAGVEELLDVAPDVTEVGLAHVGPVVVHALEPLHRHAVEPGVVVARVVVERARVLLVAHDMAATLAGDDERPVRRRASRRGTRRG